METKTPTRKEIPLDVMQEAVELARGTHLILPEGLSSLAEKIHEARLQNRKLRINLGVDPTSKSLHLGHTVVLRLLRRFQRFGHEAFLSSADSPHRSETRLTQLDAPGPDSTRSRGKRGIFRVAGIGDHQARRRTRCKQCRLAR